MTWWNTSYPEWFEGSLFSKFYSDVLVIWEACPSKRSKAIILSSIKVELKVSQSWDVTGLRKTIQNQY